jgi:uncharacterized protein
MFTETQISEILALLDTLDRPTTKIYLGCDSVRFKKNGQWFARYATVLVIHQNGSKGGRVFSHRSVERDYDVKKNRPALRLMNEVMKVTELYIQLAPHIDPYDVEIHLDISTDPKNGSNCVATQAAGYVLGTTGIEPRLKPDAWCASAGADHYANKAA